MSKSCKKQSNGLIFWSFLIAFFAVLFSMFFLKKRVVCDFEKSEDNYDLNERQKKVLELLSLRGEITVDEIMKKIKGVSERTLRRDMNKLGDMGFCIKEGNTKGSKYIYTKK